ncbi:MAG: glycerophosphodiester phosphodiesterase family protein [Frankiaceae bacterium]
MAWPGQQPAPQVIAHRGASDEVPEHTFAAYRKALDDGADALECDVRLTRDGHLVCVHDGRVDRTSNGRGRVSTLELAALADLDFSDWRARQRRVPAWRREPEITAAWDEEPDWDVSSVLTLERLLALVVDAPRRVELAIETKHPTRYAGLVEQTLVALLARFGLHQVRGDEPPRVRTMSFSSISLRRIHALAPQVPTVLLMRWLPLRMRDGLLPARVRIAGPALPVLRRHPAYVERAHAMGHPVHVWTVDAPDDIDYVLSLGVDAVITNRPALVRRRVAATR